MESSQLQITLLQWPFNVGMKNKQKKHNFIKSNLWWGAFSLQSSLKKVQKRRRHNSIEFVFLIYTKKSKFRDENVSPIRYISTGWWGIRFNQMDATVSNILIIYVCKYVVKIQRIDKNWTNNYRMLAWIQSEIVANVAHERELFEIIFHERMNSEWEWKMSFRTIRTRINYRM